MKKLFISHSSKNKVIANQLISYLERLGLEHKNMFCSSSISQGAKNGEDLNSRIGKAKNCDSGIYYSYFELFLNKFKKPMKEIIEILKEKIIKEKEGIVKDSYIDTKNELEKREKVLGF